MKCCLFCTCVVLSSVPQLESEPGVEQIGEAPENVPFAIPEKWKWVAIGSVCAYIQRGKSPKYSEIQQIPVVAQKCNQWDGFHIEKAKFIAPETAASYKTDRWLQDKDVLWNSTGLGTLGRVALYKKQLNPYGCAVADSHVTVMRCSSSLLPEYLYYYICSPSVQSVVEEISDGSTKQKELATKTIREFQFPLPPIDEQRRIIAKLNELLPLVETYGKEQEALEKVEKEFPDKLRASLLQEAIRGKLVPQLESEPEVTQIGEAPEDVPFAIPEKWKWISASYVQTLVRGITFPASAKTKMQTHKSICCLTTGSVQEKYASKADVFVDQSFMKNTRQILQVGDVVISSANSKELVGKSILWEDDSGIQKTFGGFLTVARVKDSQTMIPEYLFLVYRYMFKTGYFANLSTQTTNIANLSNKLLDSLVFPIPPLEEQHRIAAKLNELLGAVVQLENTISAM